MDPPPEPQSIDERLLALGDIVTFDHLEKELDVDAKIQAKIDRLIKRLLTTKAMKQMAGLANGPVIESTAIKEVAEGGLPQIEGPPIQNADQAQGEDVAGSELEEKLSS